MRTGYATISIQKVKKNMEGEDNQKENISIIFQFIFINFVISKTSFT